MTAPLSLRSLVGAGAVLLAINTTAQPYWTSAELPGTGGLLNALYTSDDGARLYYGGGRDLDPDQPGYQNALLKYTSAGWDTLWIYGEVRSVIEFHDTLFVGGYFETSPNDTTPAYNVEYWSDSAWHTLGVFDNWLVRSLRVLDDTLYAVGSFQEVDGLPCTGMIRRVNGQWQPLPVLPQVDFNGVITDIIKYQGRLIAIGNIYIGDQSGIAYLDGDQWHILGPGLTGGFSSVRKMIIYQDDLYVGGQISIGPGNPGRDIMRWDGAQFHKLGEVGLQRYLGDDSGFSTVSALAEHDGFLYVGGGFRYAAGLPSNGVAQWDGTRWCSVPGNLSDGTGYSGVWGGAFFQDTLFVICGYLADGDSVHFAAKFIGESYVDSCSGSVGIEDVAAANEHAPNVSAHFTETGGIVVSGLGKGSHNANLFDVEGRAIAEWSSNTGMDGRTILDPGPLRPGTYLLRIDAAQVKLVTTR